MQCVAQLENPIQEYAWGSRIAIAELLGRPTPAPRPQAELWMGAHPGGTSSVLLEAGPVPLDAWIRRDPPHVLGAAVCERFGGRLPFLFKVLAAAAPLSIQAHPDAVQAREGYARENARGLAPDAPERCYRDPRHKPELICALTPFRALRGFRPLAEIRERLARVAGPALGPVVTALEAPEPRALRDLVAGLLQLPESRRAAALGEAVAAAAAGAAEDPAYAWVERLAAAYPGDPGALAPIFLQLVTLAPGEAMFLPAGELHTYLEGVGVELMANSDNVLRGGLTAKHVDVPELLRVLRFREGRVERLVARPDASGRAAYATPADEFELSRFEVGSGAQRGEPGFEILLCTEGRVRVEPVAGEEGGLELPRGASCVVCDAARGYRLRGAGTVYAARVPRR